MSQESAPAVGKSDYLYAWNFRDTSACFLKMARKDFHESSFLDQRISADRQALVTKDMDTVVGRPVDERGRQPAFIFHTAFCCSTLLARSLDIPGTTMVFREPSTLLQLADLKRGFYQTDYKHGPLLKTTMQLMVNYPVPENAILIKPTNLANNLIPDLLAAYPRSRILLLHDELEPFLVSVLKRPRESATGIQHFLNRFLADTPVEREPLLARTNGELHYQATLAWALQKKYLNGVLPRHPGAIRTLATPDLLERPDTVLPKISDWLGLGVPTDRFKDIADSRLWNKNAKHPGRRYDRSQRAREQAELRKHLTSILDQSKRWLEAEATLMPEAFRTDLELL